MITPQNDTRVIKTMCPCSVFFCPKYIVSIMKAPICNPAGQFGHRVHLRNTLRHFSQWAAWYDDRLPAGFLLTNLTPRKALPLAIDFQTAYLNC